MNAKAVIFGCAGTSLSTDERSFFSDTQPFGFILFARNLRSEEQVRNLTTELASTVDHSPHIFIDEEGGRVSRLRTIGGWIGPPAANFLASGKPASTCSRAVRAGYRAIGARLSDLGITADCAPVLDLPVKAADPIIGDRAFAKTVQDAAILGQAALDGLHDAGIAGVIKHIPGHGRANVDSHKSLPIVKTKHAVLSAADFAPFHALRQAKMAMTAHVVYPDIDPTAPATTSVKIIEQVIRQEIGFDGLLMSDDLDMQALSGSLSARAIATIQAGCDLVLHCSGDLDGMREVAAHTPELVGKSLKRAQNSFVGTESCTINVTDAIAEADACFRALGVAH